MPRCRIYFFTYKRNYLISRSIQSLLSQTFTDWICEVHNDCPEDKFPEEYIASLNDHRFTVKNHLLNLGPTKSFNIAYSGCDEEYVSLLEDDNWWEINFLMEMINLMDQKPNLDIAWSNMRIWEESSENKWTDTGKTIWAENHCRLFYWPQYRQALGALHSNGAMIFRGLNAKSYLIPNESLFDAVELIRERSFKHPIYLYSKTLANFSLSRFTNRSNNSWEWTACQVMMLSSFILSSENREKTFVDNYTFYRKQNPTPIVNFFLSILFYLKDLNLLKNFELRDWLIFSKWVLKNNFKIIRMKKYLESQKNVYLFLTVNTENRCKQEQIRKRSSD